jgi:hypothetical protein
MTREEQTDPQIKKHKDEDFWSIKQGYTEKQYS